MTENGVERKLGELIGRFDGYENRLDRADDSRRRSHERMDEMAAGLSGVQSDMRQIDVRITATEKAVTATGEAVDRFERIEIRGRGAVAATWTIVRVVRWIGAGGTLAVILTWREIIAFFGG